MKNFQVIFTIPWLLLLLIPALALTLLPYFRAPKKYRRTRNHVVSIVLHMIIMTLAILVLSGISFRYEIPNKDNEIILLVDVSDSGAENEQARNDFVRSVLEENESYKLGIVTFGFDQVYAAPLTSRTGGLYEQYLEADLPDTSATDIAAALSYTRTLFTNPSSGKIVLISDGVETDGKANSVIRSIAAEGIKIDTVYLPEQLEKDEVQLIGVTSPDYNIKTGASFPLNLAVKSTFRGDVEVYLYDNDEEVLSQTVQIREGEQNVEVEHTFQLPGMHELHFEIKANGDAVSQNNHYYSYINLEIFDKILIIKHPYEDADLLQSALENYKVETVDIVDIPDFLDWDPSDEEGTSAAVDGLRQYDQILLMNVSNADMPIRFDEVLNSYVARYGGGLFTVGGNQKDGSGNDILDQNSNPVANAYNRNDLQGTLFQQMLPVQAVDYTPPLGVVFIVDRSGSMESTDMSTGKTKLDLAKEGVESCIRYALSERDWCGIVTLETSYSEDMELIPVPQQARLLAALQDIVIGEGTVYSGAIDLAGRALSALRGVERKHMILVSDGEPGDSYEEYSAMIKHYYDTAGITFSIISIGSEGAVEDMRNAVALGHGRYYDVWDVSTLPNKMREELNVPAIKEVVYEPFTPTIASYTGIMSGVSQANMPQLFGYYGTKAKDEAEVILSGEFVPIYAQWRYGEGMVGSFMCDLNGTWSKDFLTDPTGSLVVNNIVNALLPTQNIRPKPIEIGLTEDNYTTQLNIYTPLGENEKYEITLTSPPKDYYSEPEVETALSDVTKHTYTISRSGIHEITVRKLDAEGNEISRVTTYKTFSYSEEYNMFYDPEECRLLLSDIAQKGNGAVITESYEAYARLVQTLSRTYDPRIPFVIVAVILFLLDVAVRKFKFKWPHEIIRDRKLKKTMKMS